MIMLVVGYAFAGSLLGALIGIAIAKKQNKSASLKYGQLIVCLFIAWASGCIGIVLGNFITMAATGASDILGDNAAWYAMLGGVVGAWISDTKNLHALIVLTTCKLGINMGLRK